MLAVVVLLGVADFAQSATEPALTVSFAGYDKLMADLDMIGKLGGIPRLSERLDKPLRMMTEAHHAKGPLALRTKQPWGAVLTIPDNLVWDFYAFFPVTDIAPLIELARMQTDAKSKITEADGVFTIPIAANTMYGVQKDNWAYFANSQRTLADVASNPATLLGDLPKRYDLAVRLSLKNLTPDIRGEIVPRLREAVQLNMDQMAGESEEQYGARLDLADNALRQLHAVIGDIDNVLLGWNIDTQAKKDTHLDVEITANSGTTLAARFAQIKSGKTDFAALLLPNAALSASSISTLTDAQVTQISGVLADSRKSATKQLAKQGLSEMEVKSVSRFLDILVEVLQKTAKNKKTDAALSLMLDSSAATLLAGATVADGPQLDKGLRQLSDDLQKNGKAATRVKVSTETYKSIHLYTVSLPTPNPNLTPLVGKSLVVVAGVAGNKLLVTAGRDAPQSFKKAFDQLQSTPGKEAPPLQIRLAVPFVAKAVATLSKNVQIKAAAAMLAGFGAGAGNKNHVSLTITPISRGFRTRLEVEEGLLKVLSSLGQLMGLMSPDGF
jgi:hypothetical protein